MATDQTVSSQSPKAGKDRNSDVSIRWDAEERVYVLRTITCLPRPRAEVFEFFSDAFQLERITPPWLNFRILTPAPIDIREGCLIDYQIRLRGIPIRWRTEICEWHPNDRFMDRQLKGPYLLWEHLHTFEDIEGGTRMMDEVRYRVRAETSCTSSSSRKISNESSRSVSKPCLTSSVICRIPSDSWPVSLQFLRFASRDSITILFARAVNMWSTG